MKLAGGSAARQMIHGRYWSTAYWGADGTNSQSVQRVMRNVHAATKPPR